MLIFKKKRPMEICIDKNKYNSEKVESAYVGYSKKVHN